MPTFYSPDGSPEVWEEQPEGYFTTEEWQAAHPAQEAPAPTPQEIDSAREVEIKAELQSIDAQSGRPARAVALATVRGESPDTEDVARLEELEVQAQALREELRQITARLEAQIAAEDRML